MGSQRKTFRLLQRIGARIGPGGPEALALDRVYAPVGLDIGAIGPQEIAISIVAELVALRRGHATDGHNNVKCEARTHKWRGHTPGGRGAQRHTRSWMTGRDTKRSKVQGNSAHEVK